MKKLIFLSALASIMLLSGIQSLQAQVIKGGFRGHSATVNQSSGDALGPYDNGSPCNVDIPVFKNSNTGKSVRFEISGYQMGEDTKFLFEFGDGSTLMTDSPIITHLYPAYGEYIVNVVAFSDCGSAAYTRAIQVRPISGRPGDNSDKSHIQQPLRF